MAGNTYTDIARNIMLDAFPSTVWLSLHNANPGESGSNALPGVARQSVTLDNAVAGARSSTDVLEYDLSSGDSVTHVGFWSAQTGGNFLGYSVVTPSITLAQDGPVRLVDVSIDLLLQCS